MSNFKIILDLLQATSFSYTQNAMRKWSSKEMEEKIMKANENSIISFLKEQDTKFVIPVYQRNYEWTEHQCKQLLEDIYRVATNDKIIAHFIGSIVFIHDDVYTTGTKELVIIDGQQRLTTITLLWIVLYRKSKEVGNQKLADEIYRKYLVNEFSEEEEEEKLKLKPTKDNDKAIKALIRGDVRETFKDYSRLIENYNYYFYKIKNEDIDTIKKGISKLIYVEISLERGKDDPQKIFQSLNSTGLDLTQADLIRNYILMGLKPKEQKKIYENYWSQIEELTTLKESGINKLSDFIRDFLTLRYRDIPNKSKVFEAFKEKCIFERTEDLEVLLVELKKYSEIYSKLMNPNLEKDYNIRKNIDYINRMELSVSYPFLIEVYNDYQELKIDKNLFVEVLRLIQTYVWRRFIIGLPTNALNKVFMKLYEDIKIEKYLESLQLALVKKKGSQRFPKDNEIYEELKIKDMYNIQSKNKNYYLEVLENYKNSEYIEIEGNDKISIEHIFPQNPDPKWKYNMKDEEYNKMKEMVNTIGNLSLSGFNSSLGNKYFTEKRDMPEKGYKQSRLFLNKFVAECEKWGTDEISKRYELIYKRTVEIWKYPEVFVFNEGREETEMNIFEIDDPTNKTIEYAIFFDQKISVNFIELLTKVVSFMFESEPSMFFNTELREKLNLTQNTNDLRSALKISSTYFIEGNYNAKVIFNKIKLILEKFNINDELYITFKE